MTPATYIYDAPAPKFTGKERDNESNLDYFGARYYSSAQGRWMSPDWADKPKPVPYADLSDPQSLNLYGYVRNNPMSHADADGHCCSDWADYLDSKIDSAVTSHVDEVANHGHPDDAAETAFTDGAVASVAKGFTNLLRLGSDAVHVGEHIAEGNYLSATNDVVQEGARVVGIAGVIAGAAGVVKGTEVPESIPPGPSARPTPEQQGMIDKMGDAHGCHTCGTKTPGTKSGHWVGDHQEPTALNPQGKPQVYKPQCLHCSQVQGGLVAAQKRAVATRATKPEEP